jgi:hypothetical protein
MALVFKLIKQTPVTSSASASYADSSSYAATASYAENGGVTRLIAGPNITLSPIEGTGEITISASSAGGRPGGETYQAQYNNSDAFGGIPTLTYDGETLRATGSFFGDLTGTASYSENAVSASNALTASFITASGVHGPYGSNSVISASHAVNGGVTQLLAGSNITLSPTTGKGQVTISSTGGGGPFFNTATGSYGSFYDTTTQINPVGNIARSMSFNTTDITNGVSISGSTSPFNTYIKTENPGVYNIQFSAQVEKTDSGTDEIVIWLRKNGIDLTDTATTMTLVGNSTKVVAAWNWFVTSAANDYYQIIWLSADTGMRLLAETISGTHPGIPSVILTANRVDQFLSNTGSFSGSFTGVFTGSLQGTASWANNATTASYALQALSASFSSTASFVRNAQTASYVLNAISSSFAVSSSRAISSLFANSSNFAVSSNEASNVVGWGVASTEQINVGEVSTNSYNYIVNSQELEQSKHATINIFNYLNFT